MAKDDDYFDDGEFMDDDFLFDDDYDMEGPDGNLDRTKAQKIGRGFRNKAFDPKNLAANAIEQGMPDGFKKLHKEMDNVFSDVSMAISSMDKEMEAFKGSLKKVGRGVEGMVTKILPQRMAERFKELVAAEEGYSRPDYDAEEIKNTLSDMFGEVKETLAEREEDSKVENERFKISSKLSKMTADAVTRLANYQDSVLIKYHRKTLELQFKQYFIQRDSLEVHKATFELQRVALQQIAESSALPEAIKIQRSEEYRKQLQGSLLGRIQQSGKNKLSSLTGRIIKGASDEIRSGLADAADMIGTMSEMAGSMTDGEFGDPMEMLGEQLGDMANSTIGGMLGKSIFKGLMKNSTFRRMNMKAHQGSEEFKRGLNTMLRNQDSTIGQILSRWAGPAKQDGESIINTGETGGTAVVPWDLASRKSIVEIIPGYLSRILQQVTEINVGGPAERLTYSMERDQFITTTRAADLFVEKARSTVQTQSLKNIKNLIDEMEKATGQTLSHEARSALKDEIIKQSKEMEVINFKRLMDPNRYNAGGAEIIKLVETFLGIKEGSGKDIDGFIASGLRTLGVKRDGDNLISGTSEQFQERLGRFKNVLYNSELADGNYQQFIDAAKANGQIDILRKAKIIYKDAGVDKVSSKFKKMILNEEWDKIHDEIEKSKEDYEHEKMASRYRKQKEYERDYMTEHGGASQGSPTGRPGSGYRYADLNEFSNPEYRPGSHSSHTSSASVKFDASVLARAFESSTEKTERLLNTMISLMDEHGIVVRNGFYGMPDIADQLGVKGFMEGARRRGGNILDFIGRQIDRSSNFMFDTANKAIHGTKALGETAFEYLRTGLREYKEGINNLYVRNKNGNIRQFIDGALLKAGAYRDADDNVIKKLSDIKGVTYKVTEDGAEIVLTDEEFQEGRIFTGTGASAIGLLGRGILGITDMIHKGFDLPGKIFDKANKAGKFLKDLITQPIDVYVEGEDTPRLRKIIFNNGGYINQEGKVLKHHGEIDGPVYAKDDIANPLISTEDIQRGLVDAYGRPIDNNNLMSFITGQIDKAKQVGKFAWKTVKGLGRGLVEGASNIFNAFMGKTVGGVGALLGGESADILSRIYWHMTVAFPIEEKYPEDFKESITGRGTFRSGAKGAIERVLSTKDRMMGYLKDYKEDVKNLQEEYHGRLDSEEYRIRLQEVRDAYLDKISSPKIRQAVKAYHESLVRKFTKTKSKAESVVDYLREKGATVNDIKSKTTEQLEEWARAIGFRHETDTPVDNTVEREGFFGNFFGKVKDRFRGMQDEQAALDASRADRPGRLRRMLNFVFKRNRDETNPRSAGRGILRWFRRKPSVDPNATPEELAAANSQEQVGLLRQLRDAFMGIHHAETDPAWYKLRLRLFKKRAELAKKFGEMKDNAIQSVKDRFNSTTEFMRRKRGEAGSWLSDKTKGLTDWGKKKLGRVADIWDSTKSHGGLVKDAIKSSRLGQAVGGAARYAGSVAGMAGTTIASGAAAMGTAAAGAITAAVGTLGAVLAPLAPVLIPALVAGGAYMTWKNKDKIAEWWNNSTVGQWVNKKVEATSDWLSETWVGGLVAYFDSDSQNAYYRRKLTPMELIRFKQYGINVKDDKVLQAIRTFEDRVGRSVKLTRRGNSFTPSFEEPPQKIWEYNASLFDADKSNGNVGRNWKIWFLTRFLRVYVMHKTACELTKKNFQDLDSMSVTEKLAYLDYVQQAGTNEKMADKLYEITTSPFLNSPIAANESEVSSLFAKAREILSGNKDLAMDKSYNLIGGAVSKVEQETQKILDEGKKDLDKRTTAQKIADAAARERANKAAQQKKQEAAKMDKDVQEFLKDTMNAGTVEKSAMAKRLESKYGTSDPAQLKALLGDTGLMSPKQGETEVDLTSSVFNSGTTLGLPLLRGRVSSSVSSARMLSGDKSARPHKGVDFAAEMGDPIFAAMDGTVSVATTGVSGYGTVVYIDHIDGTQTRYGHMMEMTVKKGQKVNKGDLIGYVGNTGKSTGPHLHFEWRGPVDKRYATEVSSAYRVNTTNARNFTDPLLHLPSNATELLASNMSINPKDAATQEMIAKHTKKDVAPQTKKDAQPDGLKFQESGKTVEVAQVQQKEVQQQKNVGGPTEVHGGLMPEIDLSALTSSLTGISELTEANGNRQNELLAAIATLLGQLVTNTSGMNDKPHVVTPTIRDLKSRRII